MDRVRRWSEQLGRSLTSFQCAKTLLELLHGQRLLTSPDHGKTFLAKLARLERHTAGKLRVQAAVIFDYSPVRHDAPAAVRAIFFGGFGGNAQKNSGR